MTVAIALGDVPRDARADLLALDARGLAVLREQSNADGTHQVPVIVDHDLFEAPGPGADLVPAVQGRRVVGGEGHLPAGGDRAISLVDLGIGRAQPHDNAHTLRDGVACG